MGLCESSAICMAKDLSSSHQGYEIELRRQPTLMSPIMIDALVKKVLTTEKQGASSTYITVVT